MYLRSAPDHVTTEGLHSRSVLAGYDPDRLAAARVLVVGLGALGQNIVQDLALSGVGNLLLIDFDEFEHHNATRSPFYPQQGDEAAGSPKAPVVARKARRCATAAEPQVGYIENLIQVAGDGPVRWADVVVSAVDRVEARAWLAERCRLHGRPMVEGGFAGPEFNLSVFSADDGAVCYRCFNPDRASFGSCAAYARMAEAASIVPAIQTTAAVLAGLMSEHTIQLLHGNGAWCGQRAYGSLRRMILDVVELQPDTDCPGNHTVLPTVGNIATVPETLGGLVDMLGDRFADGWLLLAEPAIVTAACTGCRLMCGVEATESEWLRAPRCTGCGGPWRRSGHRSPQAVNLIPLDGPLTGTPAMMPVDRLGILAGGAVVITTADGATGLVTLADGGGPNWRAAA